MINKTKEEEVNLIAQKMYDILRTLKKIKGESYMNLVIVIYNIKRLQRGFLSLGSNMVRNCDTSNPHSLIRGIEQMRALESLCSTSMLAISKHAFELYEATPDAIKDAVARDTFIEAFHRDVEGLEKQHPEDCEHIFLMLMNEKDDPALGDKDEPT